jgi:hypothetical protein
MALNYLMRAKDSVTAAGYSWIADSADFAGAGYPGPNSPTNVYVAASFEKPSSTWVGTALQLGATDLTGLTLQCGTNGFCSVSFDAVESFYAEKSRATIGNDTDFTFIRSKVAGSGSHYFQIGTTTVFELTTPTIVLGATTGVTGIDYKVATGGAHVFSVNASTRLNMNGTGIGFFGAAPVAKPTVSGSRGGNAALQSLLVALSQLGLVTDSSG